MLCCCFVAVLLLFCCCFVAVVLLLCCCFAAALLLLCCYFIVLIHLVLDKSLFAEMATYQKSDSHIIMKPNEGGLWQ